MIFTTKVVMPKDDKSTSETKRRELMSAIKTQAKALGLSDQAIADKCGLKQNSVNRMMSGKFSTKIDHVITLANAVGLDVRLQ